jgi:hypothetical protein
VSENPPNAPERGRERRRPSLLVALVALLAAEALALAALAAVLVYELVVAQADSLISAVALAAFTVLAAAFLVAIALGAWRGRAWIRGAAVTVQILQLTVAIGAFQGIFARPDVGWLLLVPAIAILVLLFTRPVIAATSTRE